MKRIGQLLVLLCALSVTSQCAEEKAKQETMTKLIAKLKKGEQVTIVVIGDSNTELTFHTRGHLNWPLLLQVALFEKYVANKVIMINSAKCGTGSSDGVKRLERDVFRFKPDLLIMCYWAGDMKSMRTIIEKSRAAGIPEILLRTPNPMVAPNMPRVNPPVKAGKEWPKSHVAGATKKILALAKEMKVPVCDHYNQWLQSNVSHDGPGGTNPNKLWMRMSDASHPNEIGHLAFYRELAPFFGLSKKLSWEH
jgi:lysophospholipase L1-like esterase